MFLTKEAVRLAIPGYADAIETPEAPPVANLFAQFAEGGGELYACPICFRRAPARPRKHRANARLAGATPVLEFIARARPSSAIGRWPPGVRTSPGLRGRRRRKDGPAGRADSPDAARRPAWVV